MSDRGRPVLVTACLTHALIHVYELSVPALLVLIQAELGADDARMGLVATLYALLFGLGSLPAGLLVDRFGSKSLLLACVLGGALGVAGMAASPSLATFTVAAAGMGLALSIYHPAGTAWITHALPRSGRVFAIHGMAGNLGVAGAGLIAGVLGALVGWRGALGILALAGVALGVRLAALPAPPVDEIRARPGRGRWVGFGTLLVATAFMGMVYRGVTTFLPKFLAITFSADVQVGTAIGGALATAALVVGLAGMWCAGRLVDRGTHPARVFLIGAVVQAPFLVLTGLVAGRAALPLLMGVAFFHFFTQPAGNHLVADYTPARLRGLGYGVYFLMTFGAGSVGAAIGGQVSARVGLGPMFAVLAVLLVPAAVAGTLLLRTGRAARVPEPAG